MNLNFYLDETERQLRCDLELLALDIINCKKLRETENVAVSKIARVKARELSRQMRERVCGLYLKNPDTMMYSRFLRESRYGFSNNRKKKDAYSCKEFMKLNLIKDSIRQGKNLAERIRNQELFLI